MSHALALISAQRLAGPPQRTPIAQRLVLYAGELYRVPTSYRALLVQTGTAYITQAGHDRILQSGQALQLDSAADVALVSAMRSEQVVLELFNS